MHSTSNSNSESVPPYTISTLEHIDTEAGASARGEAIQKAVVPPTRTGRAVVLVRAPVNVYVYIRYKRARYESLNTNGAASASCIAFKLPRPQ